METVSGECTIPKHVYILTEGRVEGGEGEGAGRESVSVQTIAHRGHGRDSKRHNFDKWREDGLHTAGLRAADNGRTTDATGTNRF